MGQNFVRKTQEMIIKNTTEFPTDFDNHFSSIVQKTETEFYGKPGKEHYRLLSFLSTKFNNSNIIDLGTHKGHSACALSYNPSNKIHSFDIIDNVDNNKIRNLSNVIFHHENVFDHIDTSSAFLRNPSIDALIKSATLIFMDVDPHNGKSEFEFYNFLHRIGFTGILVCDDIWYFKEMRDNFWYKIDEFNKSDLTEIGHWSGTGIINFSDTIGKRKNNNWTLVTAYFDLTKFDDASDAIRSRDSKYYLEHSMATLKLPYNLIIYCDEASKPLLQEIRDKNQSSKNTLYIVRNFDDFRFDIECDKGRKFADYRKIICENRKTHPYAFDGRNTPSYYLFCMSRYIMMKESIESNPFNSSHFAWINLCIERMGFRNLANLDSALAVNRDKFSTCYIDYVPRKLVENTAEYFRWGRCGMCSGFFTGNKKYMWKVSDLIEHQFVDYLELGYGHADEQLYSPVYFKNPELFEHYYGDYQQMITNYTGVQENPETTIYHFIANSSETDLEKCKEACKKVLGAYCGNKFELSREQLSILIEYLMKHGV